MVNKIKIIAVAVVGLCGGVVNDHPTRTGKPCRRGITNYTEYYDKLPHYTPPLLRRGGVYGVLSLSLGELCEPLAWFGGGVDHAK